MRDDDDIDHLAALSLLIIVVAFLAAELIRYWRLQTQLKLFRRHDNDVTAVVYAPFIAPALCGTLASVRLAVLASKNAAIVSNRLRMSRQRGTTYLAYHWTLSSLLSLEPVRGLVFTTDPLVVNGILEDPEHWVKTRERTPLDDISRLACTLQMGPASLRQRKVLVHSLRGRAYYGRLVEEASKQIATGAREALASGEAMDVLAWATQVSLRLIVSAVFGEPSAESDRIVQVFLPFWDVVRTNKLKLTPEQNSCRSETVAKGVVELRRAIEDAIRRRAKKEEACLGDCMLDKLLEKTDLSRAEWAPDDEPGDLLSREELIHNLHNLLTAAFETTAHAFAATLYFLAAEPRWQALLLERDEGFARHVLKESLRLLPPVVQVTTQCWSYKHPLPPCNADQVSRTCLVRALAGPLSCPANTTVVADILAMHRSSAWGPAANSFDPLRWEALERDESPLLQQWMPFGHGQKACLGMPVAMQTVQTLVVGFLREFDVRLAPGHTLQVEQTPTLRFTNGLHLLVRQKGDDGDASFAA
jgi:cytochrome P450